MATSMYMKVLLLLAVLMAASMVAHSAKVGSNRSGRAVTAPIAVPNSNDATLSAWTTNYPNLPYSVRSNAFTSMALADFIAAFSNSGTNLTCVNRVSLFKNTLGTGVVVRDLPVTVDWNAAGYVTPVQNQLYTNPTSGASTSCGCCWAFAGVAAVESLAAIKSGSSSNLKKFSEQQALDCAGVGQSNGCTVGGYPWWVFAYLGNSGSKMVLSTTLPYTATWQSMCDVAWPVADPSSITWYDTGVVYMGQLDAGDYANMQVAVAAQPVVAALNANWAGFQFYSSGVYADPHCVITDLSHSVLVTGYGSQQGDHNTINYSFWHVKNSWGTGWGEVGYFKIQSQVNMCGIEQYVQWPLTSA